MAWCIDLVQATILRWKEGIPEDSIGLREIERPSSRGLTVTDAGLALNGLTGIQPLTITIVAIIGLPRLVPPGCFVPLSRSTGPLFSFSFFLLRSPSSFLPLTTIATVTRPSSSADPLRPSRRLRLFKVIRGNMSKSTRHALPFDSALQSAGLDTLSCVRELGYTIVFRTVLSTRQQSKIVKIMMNRVDMWIFSTWSWTVLLNYE